jgi:hypothetical protein
MERKRENNPLHFAKEKSFMKTILLPCQMSDDLSWQGPRKEAEKTDSIFWQFDLGLSSPYFPLEDELLFQSLVLSLSTFTKEFWPLFQENTEDLCLYRGPIDFSSFFLWSEKQLSNWEDWKKDRPLAKETHLRRLFCADAFSSYLQMLSHQLPDEVPITLILNGKNCGTFAESFQLLSKERFEHFTLKIEGLPLTDTSFSALCFPEESQCSQHILEQLDQMLDLLEKPTRVIQEPFLTESWEGVEFLYVLSSAVTSRGKRKLMGFCAAGGTVIVQGESLGLPNEVSFEEIRGRGIRTPGLLVPNQSR